MATTEQSRRRIRGLDGLRAIAALIVLGYHLLPTYVSVGFVGVDVFFVLSGFLITALFLRERQKFGKVAIGAFWMRRIRRLLPAVVVATFGSIALASIVRGDAIVQLPWQAFGSLTGTYNWLEIVKGSSYFESQSPLLLTNMWSLAVEQQFYIVWPVVLLLILAYVPRRFAPIVTAAIAVASAGEHALLVSGGADITRAYVGTDTHSFGLMIGATLAFLFPRAMDGSARVLRGARARLWSVAAWVALVGVLIIGIAVPYGPLMYPWGMVAVSLLTAVVIRGLLPDINEAPTRVMANILEWRPIKWMGERSYGIYLWHWPLWVIAFYAFGWRQAPTALIVTVFSFIAAELSYRYIESPIRTHGLMTWIHDTLQGMSAPRLAIPSVAGIIIFSAFSWALVQSPAQSTAQQYVSAGEQSLTSPEGSPTPTPTPTPTATTAAPTPPPAPEPTPTTPPEIPMPTGDQVTIIGDSVTLASAPALQELLPGVVINAEVSRNFQALPSIASQLDAQGQLRQYIVVALASNSNIRESDIADLLAIAGPDRRIVLVTGYGPESASWIPGANAQIYASAQAYPEQIRVADWAPIADAHQDLLAGDRVHPGSEGGSLYAQAVVGALDSF